MIHKGWKVVAALNVAILVATSPANYSAYDEIRPISFSMSGASPLLFVDGTIDAGAAYNEASLTLTFDALNLAPASGELSLYVLAEDDLTIPEGAVPVSTAVIDARVDQVKSVSFYLSADIARASFGPFHLAVALEGDAEIEGDVTISASANADDNDDGQWVKLDEVTVDSGVAP